MILKRVVSCFFFLAVSLVLLSQVPQGFNYQAIVRNPDGSVMVNEIVSIQIRIVDEMGSPAYMEIHDTTTSEFGLVNLVIGKGSGSTNFSEIDWASGPYYLEISVNEINMGTSPLLSVPYALYAASGTEGPVGPKGDKGEQGVPGPKGDPGDLKVDGNVGFEELMKEIRILKGKAGMGEVTDIGGTVYQTIKIGEQVWMAENLNAPYFADGSPIPLVESEDAWQALGSTDFAYCWYENNPLNGNAHGALYTWAAAMKGATSNDANPSGVQGICPNGWHLPSDSEWKELEMYLGMSQEEADYVGNRGTNEGGKLKESGIDHWRSPNKGASNESGFTALPSGDRSYGNFSGSGVETIFWTATAFEFFNDEVAWYRSLHFNYPQVSRSDSNKKFGFSVRCVEGAALLVSTLVIENITSNFAEVGGNLLFDGGEEAARGICWSSSAGPTISDNKAEDGTGKGTYSVGLSELSPGTVYYVRAYATHEDHTTYGEEKAFTTLALASAPLVNTADITIFGDTRALSGGEVINDGGESITARGVCWSTSTGPTTADHISTEYGGKGTFRSTLSGLSPGTMYYVRAYATNGIGTSYGEEKSFTTPIVVLPTVAIHATKGITSSSVYFELEVSDAGGSDISHLGVCYSLSPGPSISDSKTIVAYMTKAGIFKSITKWLDPGTTYYVRAYATNSSGTAYSEEKSITTLASPSIPMVISSQIVGIGETSIWLGGGIPSDGDASITDRGFCWNTAPEPDISKNTISMGSGAGIFNGSITGLSPNTSYYIRAFATNDLGTVYGEELTCTTLNSESVTDYNGNVYNRVRIGDQVWMSENLRATHFPDGAPIPLVESNPAWIGLHYASRAYCWYDNNPENSNSYGALYSWTAATQGVCPNGWHLPSDDEWKELEMYLGMMEAEANSSDRERGEGIGYKLMDSDTLYWNGPKYRTNEVGFTALPAGSRKNDSEYNGSGFSASYWTSSEFSDKEAWDRLVIKSGEIIRYPNIKNSGKSVRCISDQPQILEP